MQISHKQGRGKKIHLFLDEEYQITTDINFWAENFYKDGQEISEDEWQELVEKINYKKAVDKCYDLLSRRDHSVKELRTKLLRTVDENSAEKAISKMLDYGYLDDKKYAQKLVNYYSNTKNLSKNHVKQEMYKKGISADLIADTLENFEIDNVQSIVNLVLTKYRNKLDAENNNEKVIASLMRKGFSYSDIKSAFYRIENEEY